MEESERSPGPARSSDPDSFPSPRQATPGEEKPLDAVERAAKADPPTADRMRADNARRTEVGLGDERGEGARKPEPENKNADEDGDGKRGVTNTETGDGGGDENLPKQETTPRENPAEKRGRTTGSGKSVDKQMLVDAFEFYSWAVCRKEQLVPIDRSMTIATLMQARHSLLVQIPLAHMHVMAKNQLLLEYAQRMQKELEVADLAEELLHSAEESRLSVAKEMQLVLYLCTVKGRESRPDSKYRDLEKKLLDVLDPRTRPLFLSEESVLSHALSSGRWGSVRRMYYQQHGELGPGDLDRVCLLAAMTQDWAVVLDCAARGASMLGTPKTAEYLQKLEGMGGEWKKRCGAAPQAWKGSSPLHNALRSGRCPMKKLAALIPMDKELVNTVDLSGDSLLHAAVQGMDAEAVSVLLRHEADVNIKDSQGRTPLQLVMTEATNLVAPQDVTAKPATPQAKAASMEEQPGPESGGRPATEKGKMPPQEKDRGREDQAGEGGELSTVIDVMVSLVSLAGRSGQVIEWPAGDNGWTALHLLCAAGRHQQLENFIRLGADPHARRNGNTLIDSVVLQKNLTVNQKMKTLRVLIMDLNLTDFQGEVASDLIPQAPGQPPPCPADPCADPSLSGLTSPEPGSSHQQREAEASPGPTAGAEVLGEGRRGSGNPYHMQVFGDTDSEEGEGGSDSSAEADVDLYKDRAECMEEVLNLQTIPSLRQSGLLTSILHYALIKDKAMVDTLVKAVLARAERPAETAQELKQVFQVLHCKKSQRSVWRYMEDKALATKTVEEAYARKDFSAVMQLGRSGAALSPRELTMVMVVAAQQYSDPKAFYTCLERGGLLNGIPYRDRKMDRKGAAEVEGDSPSSASPLHCSQRTGSEPGAAEVQQQEHGEEAAPRDDSPGGDAHSKEEDASAGGKPSPQKKMMKKGKAIPSPLHRALRNRFFSVSELVGRTGIAVQDYILSAERGGSSLLHFHVGNPVTDSDMENLVFLLSHGADINAGNAHGHTLVQTLTQLRQSQALARLVRLAVELGQSIDWTPHSDGWTALHVLAASGAGEDLLFCVQHGADPTVLRPRGHGEGACLSGPHPHYHHHHHQQHQQQHKRKGRRKGRKEACLSCPQHHHLQQHEREGRPVTGREDRPQQSPQRGWWVEAGQKKEEEEKEEVSSHEVKDGLTLIDTVILQPSVSEVAKLPVLRVLLEDLQLGPLHARVVDRRPLGQDHQGTTPGSGPYRYPLEAVLQPSVVTPRTPHALLELVQLLAERGAVGEVERGAILGKEGEEEQYRQFPFCRPALDFLAAFNPA